MPEDFLFIPSLTLKLFLILKLAKNLSEKQQKEKEGTLLLAKIAAQGSSYFT